MSSRLKKPGQHANAAVLAVLFTVGLATVPVLAAPEPELLCTESEPFGSDPTASELAASPVSSGDEDLQNHLLQPDARSAARGAFADESSPDLVEDPELEADDKETPSDTGPHRASEPKPLPYKRQMYRRDI
jgi:hypothetical protein